MNEYSPLKGQIDGQPRPITNFHTMSVAALVLTPFLVFFIIEAFFTFLYLSSPLLVWIVVILFTGMSLLLLGLPNKRPEGPMFYMQLGMLCLVASGVGTLSGFYNWDRHMSGDAAYRGQRSYTNVLPTEPALAHLDAGRITFSSDAKLNMDKAVGYRHEGSMFCVVPIIDTTSESQNHVEYFAVGKDCCRARGSFTCDDYADSNAKGGLVFLNSFQGSDQLANFRKAADLVDVSHGITVSKDALFVRWVRDPDRAANGYQNAGISFLLGTSAVYLVLSIVAGFALHFCQRNVRSRITKTAYV